MPLVALTPLQPPDAVQDEALVVLQVKVLELPADIELGDAERAMVGTDTGGAVGP